MLAERRFTVAVMAAQRAGRLDPLAEEAGVSHKCLVPIAGRPLLSHVLAAVSRVPGVAAVQIAVEDGAEAALRTVPGGEGQFGVPVRYVAAADNLADSVYAAAGGAEGPVVVTTADNVLLTPGAVAEMAGRLFAGDDAVLAFARREAVLAAHPEGQRNFYRFADGEFSNCNLYGLSRQGLRAAEVFRGGGQFVRHPGRVVAAFGLVNLILLRFGLVSVDRAMARLSRRFGIAASAVILDDGAHAIDVDNARSYRIAGELLAARSVVAD